MSENLLKKQLDKTRKAMDEAGITARDLEEAFIKSKLPNPEYEKTNIKPVVSSKRKQGRNDRCLCGSGLKYKICCLWNK